MEWVSVLGPILGVIGAALTFIMRFRPNTLSKSPRSKLKDELEVLKMLKDVNHDKYNDVKIRVDALLSEVYKTSSEREKEVSEGSNKGKRNRFAPQEPALFIIGVIALVGFSLWSWYLVQDSFTWWVIGTGWGAAAGAGWIIMSYEKKKPPVNEKQVPGKAANKPVAE